MRPAHEPFTISVAITTYNQSSYIRDTVMSVLTQSLPPLEIVIVDDGSTDGTAAVLAGFGNRVRVIRQRNGGVASARNTAVTSCRGDYVALLDGDDLWHPSKLQRVAEVLSTHPSAGLLAHDVEFMSADGLETSTRTDMIADVGARGPMTVLTGIEKFVDGNFISTTSQVVVNRQAYLAVGLSDETFRVASDFDLYLRLAARFPVVLVGDVLSQWRQHDASASGAGWRNRTVNWGLDIIRVLRKARTRADLRPHAERLRQGEASVARSLSRAIYQREPSAGRWATARVLTRVATECRNPRVACLAAAVLLTPASLRRAAAAATRQRPSVFRNLHS